MKKVNTGINWWVLLLLFAACDEPSSPVFFEALNENQTRLTFQNTLTANDSLNMFSYMYFYNGAGVGAGDFNADGKIDLFFAGNQVGDRLFLNKGDFQFEDVTVKANILSDAGWSTGVSVIDINNDGLLDMYICRVASIPGHHTGNKLLVGTGVKNGIPQFEDQTMEYGLNFNGFSTMAAFLDFDLDGDLDMFLMNHSLHHNGTFGARANFIGTYNAASGDRFFRNDEGKFVDVTKEVGINSSVIGYGLGIAVSDVNLDGYPDIYIGNDFHENDYLYINQGNGTFRDFGTTQIEHTAQFSMGVDIADINNDAYPEIVSMDMLPEDPYILKRSLGEDEYNIAQMKLRYGYQHQFTRNNLQFNRKNGSFSEIGLFAGVYATDWSWAPLWIDFNNDGLRDLFVSNGIPKRLNDIDYVNYVSNDEIQQKIGAGNMEEKDRAVIEKFPQIKLKNKFYVNNGKFGFTDYSDSVHQSPLTYSNGAAYADLDNDGDLDIIVNNIDAPPVAYRNLHIKESSECSIEVEFLGPASNKNAIGAKLLVVAGDERILMEKNPVHGFQSSMEIPLLLHLNTRKPDAAYVVWPDQTVDAVQLPSKSGKLQLKWRQDLPKYSFDSLLHSPEAQTVESVNLANETGIAFLHKENNYLEFNRDPLLPHSFSTEGPAIAAGDLNADGLTDLFIGGARNQPSRLWTQQLNGRFIPTVVPSLLKDSIYEDVAAVWLDVNQDKYDDLIVVSGGNEFSVVSTMNQPRLYLNDRNGSLQLHPNAFDSIRLTGSCIAVHDVNNDGFPDLFIGGRTVPADYGRIPRSYLLINNQQNGFEDKTEILAPGLAEIGFVTDAKWEDINGDSKKDLLLSRQWGNIIAFTDQENRYKAVDIGKQYGWWNTIFAADVDGDGDMDILAGNLGLNSRLKASKNKPVKMYYADFDGNGKTETVLTYFQQEKETILPGKMELDKQLPYIKKKFLYAEDFANASVAEIIGAEALKKAKTYEADFFESVLYLNEGGGRFKTVALPNALQWGPLYSFAEINLPENQLAYAVGGNFFGANIELGRYDALKLQYIRYSPEHGLQILNNTGTEIGGQIRHIVPFWLGKKQVLGLARNNDSVLVVHPRF